MRKYRSIPKIVEAKQWFKPGDQPAEVHDSIMGHCVLATEGYVSIKPGDYIITNIDGKHYPCAPEIFEQKYEVIE